MNAEIRDQIQLEQTILFCCIMDGKIARMMMPSWIMYPVTFFKTANYKENDQVICCTAV